jgi:hypothetical protein
LTAHQIIIEARHVCRPVKLAEEDELVPVTLPMSVARMYLAIELMIAEHRARRVGLTHISRDF